MKQITMDYDLYVKEKQDEYMRGYVDGASSRNKQLMVDELSVPVATVEKADATLKSVESNL